MKNGLTTIQANQLKEGDEFKTSLKQRKFRTAKVIHHFREGDTEHLRGKILIWQPNCRQIVIPESEELYLKND